MGEETSQGISRRDLLRRGAVLGGAVMWTTPVVQTLGMGRAFAQTASPVDGGKDISYFVIHWDCGDGEFHTKFDENGQPDPGATPDCEMSLEGSTPANLPPGITVGAASGACVTITVHPDFADCEILEVLLKAGSSQSTDDPCQSRDLIADGQPHSYCTS
ncbi:MAG TPA: hypothetical protein VMS99_11615 [Acidimicrobiia bacterium]|nr:hypothetical protein [Acidimicrobiia bacterium]